MSSLSQVLPKAEIAECEHTSSWEYYDFTWPRYTEELGRGENLEKPFGV